VTDVTDLITRAKSVRIENEIARRGIKLAGRIERTGPCPVYGGRDRLAINIKKQLWNCRGCQIGGDVITLVEHLDGIDFKEAVERLAGAPETAASRPSARPESNAALAASLWREAVDIRSKPAEVYLRGRCLELPEGDCSRSMRFCPRCPFGQEWHPALISGSATSKPMRRKPCKEQRSIPMARCSSATAKPFA
jgi:NOL1/NOP2/fmu family ribosome biogenesis protein